MTKTVCIKNFASSAESEKREIAINRLIAQQRCTMVKDPEHTVIVYGKSLNSIDPSRKWLYDQAYQKAAESFVKNPTVAEKPNSEKLMTYANKMVLFVSQKELDVMLAEMK